MTLLPTRYSGGPEIISQDPIKRQSFLWNMRGSDIPNPAELTLLQLRSNLNALWSEKMLGMISIFFEFIKVRFMAQDVLYPGEGSVST